MEKWKTRVMYGLASFPLYHRLGSIVLAGRKKAAGAKARLCRSLDLARPYVRTV